MAIGLEDLMKLSPHEMLGHDETPGMEDLRNRQQIYFDDIEPGLELPKYIRKRSIVEFQRWGITMENTHRVHYDYAHAINHDKVPGALFHGSWRMSIIAAWLRNWVFPEGWPWKMSWQVREMVLAGEVTILWGRVIGKRPTEDHGLVDIEFGIRNQDDVEGAPGKATVALPLRGKGPVPYPFVAP